MHVDELEIDEELARRSVAEQFPEWTDQPLERIEAVGTDNAIFRLGNRLSVRLARRSGPTQLGGKEFEWLPRLAPLLPLSIPVPCCAGTPDRRIPMVLGR